MIGASILFGRRLFNLASLRLTPFNHVNLVTVLETVPPVLWTTERIVVPRLVDPVRVMPFVLVMLLAVPIGLSLAHRHFAGRQAENVKPTHSAQALRQLVPARF